jgi:hypothetical protein
MIDTMAEPQLSNRDLEQRVSILLSLRRYLSAQREKFRRYLDLLDKEHEAILAEDAEKLHAQAQLETQVVKEICSFQKVIRPLEDLYQKAYPEREHSVPQLQESLARLREQILTRNRRNRMLLKDRMAVIRQEITSLRRKKKNVPIFSENGAASLIDIRS